MPAEGPDFTPEEQETIANTIYDCSTIFRWQQDDMLVIDNIRTAHGRLNVKGERSILTCLGDFYTT
jgi:alpha-ketoglutarate-dependent taurine dioxygenase